MDESGWCQAGEEEIRIQGHGEAQVSILGSMRLSQPFRESEGEDVPGRNNSVVPEMLLGVILACYRLVQDLHSMGFLSHSC